MPDKDEPIVCPNCNFPATRNYCAECGQRTHLHKETFWGLIVHFIGHYFHYDSMFFKTMKALWFSPGKLTLAYWNKQRARYIPPISLYIFISAVYFLLSFSLKDGYIGSGNTSNASKKGWIEFTRQNSNNVFTITDSVVNNNPQIDSGTKSAINHTLRNSGQKALTPDTTGIVGFFNKKVSKIKDGHGEVGSFIREKLNHNIPKLFFFMIPILALMLKVLYVGRKDVYFVDHAIFAIHFQAFWFSLFILDFINTSNLFNGILKLALLVIAFIYMVKALRKVYGSGKLKAHLYTISLAFGYTFFLGILFILDLLLIVLMA